MITLKRENQNKHYWCHTFYFKKSQQSNRNLQQDMCLGRMFYWNVCRKSSSRFWLGNLLDAPFCGCICIAVTKWSSYSTSTLIIWPGWSQMLPKYSWKASKINCTNLVMAAGLIFGSNINRMPITLLNRFPSVTHCINMKKTILFQSKCIRG